MQLKQYIDTILQAKAQGVPVNWEEVANYILMFSQQEIQGLTQQLEELQKAAAEQQETPADA
jgi:hypothetical protein